MLTERDKFYSDLLAIATNRMGRRNAIDEDLASALVRYVQRCLGEGDTMPVEPAAGNGT